MPDRTPVMPDLGFGDDDLDPADKPAGGVSDAAGAEAEPDVTPLEHRPTPAERVLARIGHRGFARPRVAVSSRIFRRYRVRDPWDPDPDEPEDPVALGPVSLKLGDRRQPAPHLAPPKRKDKSKRDRGRNPGSFRPRVPQAGSSTSSSPSTPPRATSRPAASAAGPPKVGFSALASEFGATDTRQPLRRPLPVRPDLGVKAGASAAPGPVAPSGPDAQAPAASSSAAAAASSSPPAASGRSGPTAGSKTSRSRSSGGRFRMASTRVSSPVVKEIRRLDEVTPEEAAAPVADEAPAPPPRAAMPKGDGLDDLFGMAAAGGRMTLGERKAKPSDPVDQG